MPMGSATTTSSLSSTLPRSTWTSGTMREMAIGTQTMVNAISSASRPTANAALPLASWTNLGPDSTPAANAYSRNPIRSARSIGITAAIPTATSGSSTTFAMSETAMRRLLRSGSTICPIDRSRPRLNMAVARKTAIVSGSDWVRNSFTKGRPSHDGCSSRIGLNRSLRSEAPWKRG